MTATFLVFLLITGGATALIPPGEVGGDCLQGTRPCQRNNSECIEDTCLCANFYRFVNGSCITDDQSVSLGKTCRGGGDCRGQGEFCSSYSVCLCLSTFIEIGKHCRPAVYPGQFGCEDSRQCNKGFPGSECSVQRVCVCPAGMIPERGTCIPALHSTNVILSDDRFNTIRRSPSNFFSRRRYQQPSNQPGGLSPDAICSVDADCSGYPLAFCDGVCRCVPGALNAGSTCISSGNAIQPAGSCAAGQTYVTEAGSCMTVQQPGEPCQYSQQCAASEPGAFCLRLKCECVYGMKQAGSGGGCTFVNTECPRRGYIWIPELGECKEVLPPGGRGCSHSLQCKQAYPDATCFFQTCTCPQSFPIAIDGTCGRNCSAGEAYSGVTGQCLPTVKPGNQCLYSSQCHAINPGMICDRNACRCPSGMVYSGTKCTQQCPVGYIVNNKGVCSPGCRNNQVEFEGECLDQVGPGALCNVNAQCMGGASCQSGSCVCPRGMIPRGSVCVYLESPPGGICGDGQQCSGGSFCSNGNCTCPAGRQIVNGVCLTPTTVDIGGACVRVGVACGGGSICVAGICVCPLGQTPWNNFCVDHRTALPGESCSRGEECTGGSSCDSASRKCECIRSTQMVIGSTCQERLRSHPGYPCSNGEICVGGSSCLDGRCACPEGRIEVNKQCISRPTVGAGDVCGNGEICGGGSECDYIQKKCTCKRGQQIINNQCVEVLVVPPGDVCSGALVRCGGGAYCVRGRCECPSNQVPLAGKCTIQKQVPPGRSCTSAEICMGRSVCRDGVCQCTSDMILVGTSCEIRRKVRPMENCRPSDECLGGSKCNGHICECPPGQIVQDSICQPRQTRRPGVRCSVEDICIGQSICVQGKCQCRPGEKPINGVCTKTPQVIPGGSCAANDECIGGASCRGGICMCPTGHTIIAHVCKAVIKAMPGNTCANGETCDGGSFCHQPTKFCRCQPGYMIAHGRCQPVDKSLPTVVDPGMSCKEGEQCRGASECREGMCVCPEGLFIRENKCLPSASDPQRKKRAITGTDDNTFLKLVTQAEKLSSNGRLSLSLGDRCSAQSSCTNSGQCINGFCRCSSTEVQAGTSCLPRNSIGATIVQPGQDCQAGFFCDGGASCVSFFCRCSSGYEPNSGICTPILAKASDDCSAGQRCSAGSLCVQGKCICPKGFTNVDGNCVAIGNVAKSPGLNCLSNPFICTGGSTCIGGICTCPTGTIAVGGICTSTTAITSYSPPGGPCVPNQIECTGNAVCANGFCVCPGGEQIRNGACVSTDSQADPGQICQEGVTVCTGNSLCTNGICTCPTGQASLGGQCVRVVTQCNPPCSGSSTCVQGSCQCNQGFSYVNGQCLPQCNPSCQQNSACQQGVCQCNPGYSYSNGYCQPTCTNQCTNGVCNNGICQCNPGYSFSNGNCQQSCNNQCTNGVCNNGVCQCNPGYVYSNGQCTPQCFSASQCTPNSSCQQGTCVCNTGYILVQDQCTPQCFSTAQCTPNSSCQQGVCTCNSGYTYTNGQCSPQCYSTQQCNPNSSCQQGSCSCNTGYVYYQGQCTPQCYSTSQCTPNSSCQQNACVCNAGYTYSQGQCTPQCYSNNQCTPNSSCQQGNCVCNTGYNYSQGQCSPQCYSNTQCNPNSSCQQGTCVCNTGYSYSNGQCYQQCSTNFQCTPNSSCQNSVCTCNTGYVYSNGQCTAQCLSNAQCTPNSNCQQGTCTCNTGYVYSNGQCNPQCYSSNQCTPNSSCQQGTCTCNTGYYYSNGQCSPQCNSNTQCTPNASCQQGTCTCNTGYSYSNGQCYPSCSSNYQCIDNSSCQQGICACNSGYVYSQGQCTPQCSPQCQTNSFCQQGSCQCSPGYVPGGTGNCQPNFNPSLPINPYYGLPGQPCDNRQGALLCRNRALCVNNLCICPTNLILAGRECVEYAGDAYPGQSCNPTVNCRGGASCSQGMCRCQPGYYPSSNNCIPNFQFQFSFQTTPNPFEIAPGSNCDPLCEFQPCLQNCGGGSRCVGGICTCPYGTYAYNSRCVPQAVDPLPTTTTTLSPGPNGRTARPGDQCDFSITCTGGSSCILGSCRCDAGYTPSYDRNSCVRTGLPLSQRSYPGGTCVKDSDCQGNSYCSQTGICSCMQDEEVKGQTCTKRPNLEVAYPGSTCPANGICSAGATCQNGYCVCPASTATNSTGSCVSILVTDTASALPGSRCRISGPSCEGGSWCVDGYCLCRDGSKNLGDGKCSGGNGNQGTGSGSGQLPTPQSLTGKKRCTSFRECDEPRVCSLSGYCDCPFTMTETVHGVCVYRNNLVPPGSYCDGSSARCQPPSTCVSNRCRCPTGYVEQSGICRSSQTALTGTNSKHPRESSYSVPPGSACLPGDTCVEGASCILGICVCSNGALPDNTACRLITKRGFTAWSDVQMRYSDLRLRPPEERLRPCPSDDSCRLPDCFCSQTGTIPPGGLQTKQVPQMIVLTFDDPVTDRTINIYRSVFGGKLRNPNGCPIKGTFFISHQFNNYDQTQWLYARGMEIGLNSITHEKLNNATKERWRHEMIGLRESLKAFSYVESAHVKGIRAPHLLLGGDEQFEMMKENGLLYDSSMTAREGPVWPQTLDYQLAWDCGEQKCPSRVHKGVWSIPMQLISSNDAIWHSLPSTAIKPYDTRESTLHLLQRNFYRNYNGNRAPFVLNVDSDFLTYLPDNGVVHAVEDFLKEALNKTDVYVVTATQAIEWMKRPIRIDEIAQFKPWQCNYRLNDHVQPCDQPSLCTYDSRNSTRQSFRVCGNCPKNYKNWLEECLEKKSQR